MRFQRATILDCYVDEPSCLGVPPYISPYPRYAAGALFCGGIKNVSYFTIDQVRKNRKLLNSPLLIIIGGVSVPGKYIGGVPASPQEIEKLAADTDAFKILGGPLATHGFGMIGGRAPRFIREDLFDIVAYGDLEAIIFDFLKGEEVDGRKRIPRKEIKNFAINGAKIVAQHQDFPHTICEIETYRGCLWRKCSFCIEPSYGPPDFREPEDIIKEVGALYKAGIRHFRLGAQPDIFAYGAEDGKPSPEKIRKLYQGIRKVAPGLKTLHLDNANPKFIASHPDESMDIIRTIIKYHTPGDVAALGGETADPAVRKRNRLNASAEDIMDAVRIINEIGSRRRDGIPELLPGLNFVFGLLGETNRTYELNYEFLRSVHDSGLLVRRINLRQVAPMKGTKMFSVGDRIIRKHRNLFRFYKEKIRKEIDLPMLKKVFPVFTVLPDVRTETYEKGKNLTYARQLGSYPILVGIPAKLPLRMFYKVIICSHGFRSVTGVPVPVDINRVEPKLLSLLPGVGEKRAGRILRGRPFSDYKEFIRCLDDKEVGEKLKSFLFFGRGT